MSPGHYAVLKVSSYRSLPLQDSMNFHSLEVVDRISETQLQVGENSMLIIYRDGVSHKKHGTLNQCRFNVGPPSTTLAQHEPSINWSIVSCQLGPGGALPTTL